MSTGKERRTLCGLGYIAGVGGWRLEAGICHVVLDEAVRSSLLPWAEGYLL